MKKSFVVLFLILLLLETQSLSNSLESEPGTSFKLQTDTRSGLTIFSKTDPVNLTVEINVTYVNAKLFMNYDEPLGGVSYEIKTLELFNNQNYTYKVNTNHMGLFLENRVNDYVNSTATGFYRVKYESANQTLTWSPFKLLESTPNSIELFLSEESWINNISLNLGITELVGGKFLAKTIW